MRAIRLGSFVLTLVVLAAACGDDDDGPAASGSSTAPSSPSGVTATSTSASGSASASASASATSSGPSRATPASVATGGAASILGSGIPSGDSCPAHAPQGVPGVTDTEIRVGGIVSATNPIGNPYEDTTKSLLAYFKGVNDAGGVCGRKLEYVRTIDDQSAASRKR